MKRYWLFLLSLVLICLILSGCGGQQDAYNKIETVGVLNNDEEQSTLSTMNQSEVTIGVSETKIPSETSISNGASSEDTTTPEKPLSSDEKGLVVTAYSNDNVTLPKIQIDSVDVNEINARIYNRFHESNYCDYTFFSDNNILSVLLFVYEPGGSYFSIYSVNTKTKREMNNTDFLLAYNLNSNSVVERISAIEEERIDSKQWINKEETVCYTLNEDNLNEYDLAIGPNGIIATLNEWTGLGSGGNMVLIDLQKESVYETLSDIKK